MLLISLAIEIAAIVVVFLLARDERLGRHWLVRRSWATLTRLGRRPCWSVATVGLATLAIGIGVSAIRCPVPEVHDEFSYLLAADTFAQGRLTNPPHPMWVHFETFHVLCQPTYMSKYPPAQGLMLALGQALTGYPLVGVWLSTALAAASVCWMLQGWVPGRWALLGGLLVAFHSKIEFYWGQNFWGGQVAMIGGALLLGALPRIWKKPTVRSALMMAVGALILANSRPYEGLALCLPVAAAMVVWMLGRRRPPLLTALGKVVVPATVMLAAGFGAMLYYNAAVTGDPWKTPYQVHHAQYGATPLLLWQASWPVPEYRHRVLKDFYEGYASDWYHTQRNLSGALLLKTQIAIGLWFFFLHPVLTVPLLTIRRIMRRRAMWFVIATLMFSLAASAFVPWSQPHYFAPVLPLVLLLIVQGMRQLRTSKDHGRSSGRVIVYGLLLIYLSLFCIALGNHFQQDRTKWQWDRARLEATLTGTPGRHLVVVRYRENHPLLDEWVYNEADIDRAKVVWAREMDPVQNVRMMEYFHDRRVWLLEADRLPRKLVEHKADTPQR